MPFNIADAQLGDILITVVDNAVSHCGIVAGMTVGGNPRPQIVYHATTGGILNDDIVVWRNQRGKAGVFRMRGLRYLTVRGVKAGKLIANTAVTLAGRCRYSKPRAWFQSWMGTSTYGEAGQARVAKYLARLGTPGNQFITTVYCSEFVELSYQLAAKGDDTAPFLIDLDGKHSLPKDLRNWLLSHCDPSGKWLFVGEFG
jgi:hypothetical protein